MLRVIHTMRHDAIAISLYVYLTLVLIPQTFHLTPLPLAMQDQSDFLNIMTTGSVWAGCLVCGVGRMWKDDLDGGAIEQFGLVASCIGWLLYLYAFVPMAIATGMGWFTASLCGWFLIAFGAQWWLIRRWRKRLRVIAGSDVG